MTQYEILKANESLLRLLKENNVNTQDVLHLEAYEELRRLESEGHKKTFIVHYLSERFGIDVATLYRISARMKRIISIS